MDAEGHVVEDRGLLLERFRTPFALLLTVLVAVLIVWNLAPMPVRDPLHESAGPLMRVARIDQSWAFFAPEVGLVSTDTWVEIERTDGTTEIVDITPEAPVLRTLRTYRWIRYEESLFATERLWLPALRHVYAEARDPASIVELRLIGAETAPTVGDSGPYDPDWRTTVLAVLEPS